MTRADVWTLTTVHTLLACLFVCLFQNPPSIKWSHRSLWNLVLRFLCFHGNKTKMSSKLEEGENILWMKWFTSELKNLVSVLNWGFLLGSHRRLWATFTQHKTKSDRFRLLLRNSATMYIAFPPLTVCLLCVSSERRETQRLQPGVKHSAGTAPPDGWLYSRLKCAFFKSGSTQK